MIDESQDMGVPQLRFLAALGGDRADALFFAGDLGQRIFQTPFSWRSLGVDVRGIHIRDMTRKWASASSSGRLTFDVDLLDQPLEKRSEVVVHELVHLKVGNHGPLFRSLVSAHLSKGRIR